MKKQRVLVVEDEVTVVKFIAANLHAEGYDVLIASDGKQALDLATDTEPDLVILDINLPAMNGFEVCRLIRERSLSPIIVLSARGALNDKLTALDLGADDYITKPFAVEELLARVRAALRRTASQAVPSQGSFMYQALSIDFNKRRVIVRGQEIALTPTEYSLLKNLVQNAGKVVTQRALLNMVWGSEYGNEGDYVRAYIRRLRKKLELDPANPQYITTITGVGYRFNA